MFEQKVDRLRALARISAESRMIVTDSLHLHVSRAPVSPPPPPARPWAASANCFVPDASFA